MRKSSVKKVGDTPSPGVSLGVGLGLGLGLGWTGGSAGGGEFVPAWGWTVIAFALGGVAVLLIQWATGRDAKRRQVAADQKP